MTVRAIDCWVNVNMSGLGRPDYLKDVAKNYFKQGEDFFRDYTIEEILKTMDALGVEKAILTTDSHQPSRTCCPSPRSGPIASFWEVTSIPAAA